MAVSFSVDLLSSPGPVGWRPAATQDLHRGETCMQQDVQGSLRAGVLVSAARESFRMLTLQTQS